MMQSGAAVSAQPSHQATFKELRDREVVETLKRLKQLLNADDSL